LASPQRDAILSARIPEVSPVSISIYDQSIATMSRMLTNLDNILSKAEAYAGEEKIEPSVLLQSRLYPNMFNFIFQVQVTTDMAKSCAARLSGTDIPKWTDDEQSFADLHARIKKAQDYLSTFKSEQFEGSESREVKVKSPRGTLNFNGQSYLLNFVLPNFYFHMTTAYNLLRRDGLNIGKGDFLGGDLEG
jgi:hypothetical protein